MDAPPYQPHIAAVWWILVLAALLILSANVAFVQWRYALVDPPERIDVPTKDGWTVAAWYRPAKERRSSIPVVLCHGLANNHAIMEFRPPQNLARYLSEAGFDCYSVDLRGAGVASAPDDLPTDATIDDHVQYDLPALVDAVCKRAGSTQVYWIGHSLGGVVGLAASSTTLVGRFAAMVTIGSPVVFAFGSQLAWLTRLARGISVWGQFDSTLVRLIAPLAGFVNIGNRAAMVANVKNFDGVTQRFLLANVFAPIWKGVTVQLDDWMATKTFRSLDRSVDYMAGLQKLTAPVLVLGGTVDGLTPVAATQALFEALPGGAKQMRLFEGYGHGDLVVGSRAPEEVYPVIRDFLTALPQGRGLGERESRSPAPAVG